MSEIPKEVMEYVQQQRAAGYVDAQIREALEKTGWDAGVIDGAMASYGERGRRWLLFVVVVTLIIFALIGGGVLAWRILSRKAVSLSPSVAVVAVPSDILTMKEVQQRAYDVLLRLTNIFIPEIPGIDEIPEEFGSVPEDDRLYRLQVVGDIQRVIADLKVGKTSTLQSAMEEINNYTPEDSSPSTPDSWWKQKCKTDELWLINIVAQFSQMEGDLPEVYMNERAMGRLGQVSRTMVDSVYLAGSIVRGEEESRTYAVNLNENSNLGAWKLIFDAVLKKPLPRSFQQYTSSGTEDRQLLYAMKLYDKGFWTDIDALLDQLEGAMVKLKQNDLDFVASQKYFHEMAKKDITTVRDFRDEKNKFHLRYPETWVVEQGEPSVDKSVLIRIYLNPKGWQTIIGGAIVPVSVTVQEKTSLEEFIQHSIQKSEVLRRDEMTLSGSKALFLQLQNKRGHYKNDVIISLHNGLLYSITGPSVGGDDPMDDPRNPKSSYNLYHYKEVFDNVLKTFRFL